MLRLYNLTKSGELHPTTQVNSAAILLGVPQSLILLLEGDENNSGVELYNLITERYPEFQLINIGEPCADGSYEVEFINPVDIKHPDVKDSDILPNKLQGVL